jgi:hypothetical protein
MHGGIIRSFPPTTGGELDAVDPGRARADAVPGFGHVGATEREAPNMFANLV